jgi:hypothetical protein
MQKNITNYSSLAKGRNRISNQEPNHKLDKSAFQRAELTSNITSDASILIDAAASLILVKNSTKLITLHSR